MKLRKVLDVRRRGLRTIVAQIILLSLVLGMFHTSALAALPHIFNDGFEGGDLSNWTPVNGLVVQQDEVYAGEYAVRGTSTTGTPAYAYKPLSATYTELYYRLWFKVISQGETNQVVIQRFRTASNTAILAVFVGQNGTLNLRNEFTNANVASTTPVSQGVWHQLQTRIKVDVATGVAGESEVWLDDTRVDSLSITQDLGTTPVGTIQMGESSALRIFDIALDRVAVDTEFIDPADPPEIETPPPGPADVNVTIDGAPMTGSPFTLQPGESTRQSFDGIDAGPVQFVSDENIVAAERFIYKVQGKNTSYSEIMALPNSQLDKIYWLPWYNNTGLNSQLRFANVSGSTATVHVYIDDEEMLGSPFTLQPGESTRQSFDGIDAGPVKIVSNRDIVAAERFIYKVQGLETSYSEIMALPNSQLDKIYWLPWYNNTGLSSQLRFANVDTATATVHVYIDGNEMLGSPFTLQPGESTRQSFDGIDAGPVQIVSDQNIVAAERFIYKVQGLETSYSEIMALPNSQLDLAYWLPWYNNTGLDSQLRFALP